MGSSGILLVGIGDCGSRLRRDGRWVTSDWTSLLPNYVDSVSGMLPRAYMRYSLGLEEPEFVAILAYIMRVVLAGLKGVRRSRSAEYRSLDVVPVVDWRKSGVDGSRWVVMVGCAWSDLRPPIFSESRRRAHCLIGS